ncbi:orotidine-5'-phosphate decarboxylase [Candidatus Gracilibacteria bacterium]|nr:orotidine-5'-phosphate decarboxylase [Candidatus Gracilibacteria bacterium]
MNKQELFEQIKKKRSFLCVGLDTDLNKIPKHMLIEDDPESSIFNFNKAIVDATAPYVVAYKPNLAFYECYGSDGWRALERTARYIVDNYPDIFLIADAKRGDIGNTSTMYAKAFLQRMPFDAITVAPYMGEDSVTPFLQFPGKWAIILALTSNKGSFDFQQRIIDLQLGEKKEEKWEFVYQTVLRKSQTWGTSDNIMYVVGATKAEHLETIRKFVPNHFLLIPGVGAQGGSLQEVAKYGLTNECGLLVNNSRAIIYASDDENFAIVAKTKAMEMQVEMELILLEKNII